MAEGEKIDPLNLVFLDEMGVRLGLTRSHARYTSGSRLYDFKPFYRGAKVKVVGAISQKKSSRINDTKWVDGWQSFSGFDFFIEQWLIMMSR